MQGAIMQVQTTFRGLNRSESATATTALERGTSRLDKLLDRPVPLRAVVEGGSPNRVTLSMSVEGEDLVAQSSEHDLSIAITTACDRLRRQLISMRRRRQTTRQKTSSQAPN
jgi:ribosome-associated translation inhibitor RaiA